MLAAANRIPTSRVDEVFDIVGLAEVKRKKPRGFSMGMAQRLGLAQALLGDPRMLILDEPANGLDPHGIHWLRDVLKSLAGQGRTVFVSSHLLAEMSLMADELVVIGRGKMIDNGPVDGFVKKFTQTTVLVRTPAADTFGDILRREGAELEPLPDGALVVSGADASAIGELAHREGIVLHELAPQSASLEQAFMSATGASEEFVAHEFIASVTAPANEDAPEAAQAPDDPRGGGG
jgi:ABC-2 type transport system ATP-binding protein